MRSEADGRRLARRYPKRLAVDVLMKGAPRRVHTRDLSRHGLYLELTDAPPVHHAVSLTVHLPTGPFQTMAVVARQDAAGAGLKLFCLGSEAKLRWDSLVETVSGRAVSLAPRAAAAADSATFLVQLDTVAEMRAFYERHVQPERIVFVTPRLNQLGAEVVLVLVHPTEHTELSLRAVVASLPRAQPALMGIRFMDIDAPARAAFRRFVHAGVPEQDVALPSLVEKRRRAFTEYAFYSPRVAPPPSVEGEAIVAPDDDLATVEGELLELPELELVDKHALFDFQWRNDEEEPNE